MAKRKQQRTAPTALLNERNPFSRLKAHEVEELLDVGTELTFQRGQFLFRSGEKVTGIFCLLGGAVKISQDFRGRSCAVRFASEGEWVGHRSIFTQASYLGTAEARDATSAFFVPAPLLLKFFGSNPEFARQLFQQITEDLERAERRFAELKDLNVPSRLISLFRQLDEKFGAVEETGRRLSLRLSKVEISELIGASQEVVVRQISQWKKEALVRETGKRYWLSSKLLDRVIRA